MKNILILFSILIASACSVNNKQEESSESEISDNQEILSPKFRSDTVKHDTDDPAVWINYANPSESLILGTDKDEDGA
ncbi:MAG: 3-phytase, partial [Cyclobacteriaceae bacterium]